MTDQSAFFEEIARGGESSIIAINKMRKILRNTSKVKKELQDLQPSTIHFKRKYNLIKTAGTSLNVIGASTALVVCATAYFTGDDVFWSWMPQVISLLGTSCNMYADFINRTETSFFLEKISQITSQLQSVYDDLDKALDDHKNEMQWIKEKCRLNESTLTYFTKNTYFASYNILAIRDTTGRGKKFLLLNAEKFRTANKQWHLNGTETVNNFVKKVPSGKPVSTARSKTLRGTLIAVNVCFVVWEITSLVSDWKENHPSTQAIKEFFVRVEHVEKIISSLLTKYQGITDCKFDRKTPSKVSVTKRTTKR